MRHNLGVGWAGIVAAAVAASSYIRPEGRLSQSTVEDANWLHNTIMGTMYAIMRLYSERTGIGNAVLRSCASSFSRHRPTLPNSTNPTSNMAALVLWCVASWCGQWSKVLEHYLTLLASGSRDWTIQSDWSENISESGRKWMTTISFILSKLANGKLWLPFWYWSFSV